MVLNSFAFFFLEEREENINFKIHIQNEFFSEQLNGNSRDKNVEGSRNETYLRKELLSLYRVYF